MHSSRNDLRVVPAFPDDTETQFARVRGRMDADEVRSSRCFEVPEVLDGEAELIAAGLGPITRRLTDLAKHFAIDYKLLAKYLSGGRGCPMWIVSAMRELAKTADPGDDKSLAWAARQWCLAYARAMVQPLGFTVEEAATQGEIVPLTGELDELASILSRNTMLDMVNDGRIDSGEASRRLPEVQAMKQTLARLESGLMIAASKKGSGK